MFGVKSKLLAHERIKAKTSVVTQLRRLVVTDPEVEVAGPNPAIGRYLFDKYEGLYSCHGCEC